MRHGDSDELLYLAGQCAIRKDPLSESLEGRFSFRRQFATFARKLSRGRRIQAFRRHSPWLPLDAIVSASLAASSTALSSNLSHSASETAVTSNFDSVAARRFAGLLHF